MAEGFARKMLPQKVKVFSAGINPQGINPMAVKVMQEIGIDISGQKSKYLVEIPIDEIEVVITLCGDAKEQCPVFLKKVKKLHWSIEDPLKAVGSEEEVTDIFRKVRDRIKIYVNDFVSITLIGISGLFRHLFKFTHNIIHYHNFLHLDIVVTCKI